MTFMDLISEGIIPGIGGIVIFVPQIAFLFLFISKSKSRENQLKLVFFGAEIEHFSILSQKNQLF